jgi:hypothetical protein
MPNRSRIALVGLLVVLLGGCVVTPPRTRAPMGDFVTNIASSAGSASPTDARAANAVV